MNPTPSQPGHPDLILAEFQARVRSGEFERGPDPAEERTKRLAAMVIRLVIVLVVCVLIILNYSNTPFTVAVVAFFALAVAAETWVWRRRHRAETEELTELREPD